MKSFTWLFSVLLTASIIYEVKSRITLTFKRNTADIFNFYDLRNDSLIGFFGNSENDSAKVDYLRLLQVYGNHFIVGGANHIYNLTITKTDTGIKLTKVSTYHWQPDSSIAAECRQKASDPDDCNNYIRVFSIDENAGNILICGTYAFKPKCRLLDLKTHQIKNEFSGTGLAPLNPHYNGTFYLDHENLYSATVSDFAGADSLIYRHNIYSDASSSIRTERNNLKLLNKPTFAGSLHTDKYVYFFFREKAVEAETIDGYGASGYYSRVARVCKTDKGGPTFYANEWTTFVKARLNCSLPGSKQFYFDQIMSISNITHNYGSNDGIIYATYVSEYDFLSHSVICAFNLSDIDRLFDQSDYLVTDPMSVAYYRKSRDPQNSVGQCRNNSQTLTPDQMLTIKSSPLMADLVPNIFGKAVGIYEGQDHYNHITVHSNVHLPEHGHRLDVIYVGTDQGNVIKMLNFNGLKPDLKDPMLKIAIIKVADVPIRKLTIFNDQYLIVVTDRGVHALPLQQCQKLEGCKACLEARDPYCGWNIHQKSCMAINRSDTAKHFLQDVLEGQTSECADFDVLMPPLVVNKEDLHPPPQKILSVPLSKQDLSQINNNSVIDEVHADKVKMDCDCKLRKSLNLRHCNCSNPWSNNIDEMAIKAVQEPTDKWYKSPTFLVTLAALQFFIIIALIGCYIRKTKKSKAKKAKPQPGYISAFDQPTGGPLGGNTIARLPRPTSITKLSPGMTALPPYATGPYGQPCSPTTMSSTSGDFEPFETIHTTNVMVNDQGYASGSLGSKSGSDVVATFEGQTRPFNPYLSGGSSTASSA